MLVNRQPQESNKPRFRGRSLETQLQEAIRDAQKLMATGTDDASISRMKLTQTRITSLQRLLNRKESAKLKKALIAVEQLKAVNDKLRRELQQALVTKPAARQLSEVELALQNYEKEKGGANVTS